MGLKFHQKNWSPFVYTEKSELETATKPQPKKKLYWVQSFAPFIIMEINWESAKNVPTAPIKYEDGVDAAEVLLKTMGKAPPQPNVRYHHFNVTLTLS